MGLKESKKSKLSTFNYKKNIFGLITFIKIGCYQNKSVMISVSRNAFLEKNRVV